MKTNWVSDLILIACLIFLVNHFGFAQTASVGVQPSSGNTVVMVDHPRHAEVTPLQSDGVTITASGTRPLSDFPDEPKPDTPLGDVARFYRTHKYVPMKGTK